MSSPILILTLSQISPFVHLYVAPPYMRDRADTIENWLSDDEKSSFVIVEDPTEVNKLIHKFCQRTNNNLPLIGSRDKVDIQFNRSYWMELVSDAPDNDGVIDTLLSSTIDVKAGDIYGNVIINKIYPVLLPNENVMWFYELVFADGSICHNVISRYVDFRFDLE